MWAIKIDLKEGKSHTLDITPAARCAFESEFKTGFIKRLREEERESDIYWLAHNLMNKKGLTQLEFGDGWLDTVIECELVVDSPNGLTDTETSTK